MTIIQPDNIKFLKTDINRLADYKQQEETYDRNFMRFQNRNLAYETPWPYILKVPFNYSTPQQNLHYQPKIYRDYSIEHDGKTPYFLNNIHNRQVDVSGTIYNIKDIPIRTATSVRQY